MSVMYSRINQSIQFCMQLTKAYMDKMMIDSSMYIQAHQDLFVSCQNVAMSLYDIFP